MFTYINWVHEVFLGFTGVLSIYTGFYGLNGLCWLFERGMLNFVSVCLSMVPGLLSFTRFDLVFLRLRLWLAFLGFYGNFVDLY